MSYVIQHEGEEFEFEDNVPPQKAKAFVMKKFGLLPTPKPAASGKDIMDQAKKNVFARMERGQKVQDSGVKAGQAGYLNTLAGLMKVGSQLDPVRFVNSKLPFDASKQYVDNQQKMIEAVQSKAADLNQQSSDLMPKNADVIDKVAKSGIEMIAQLPKYAAANTAGSVLGFAGLGGVDAAGQNADTKDIVKEAIKGGVTGGIFKKAEGLGKITKPILLGSSMAGMTALEGGSKEDIQQALVTGAVLGLMGGTKANKLKEKVEQKIKLKEGELRRGVREFVPQNQNAAFSYDPKPENFSTKTLIRPEIQSKTFESTLMSNAGKREFIPTQKPNVYHAGGKQENTFLKQTTVGQKFYTPNSRPIVDPVTGKVKTNLQDLPPQAKNKFLVSDIVPKNIQYPDSMVYSAKGTEPVNFKPKTLENGKTKLVPQSEVKPTSVSVQKQSIPYPDQYSFKVTKDFETRVSGQKKITPLDVAEIQSVADFDKSMSNYVFGSDKIKPDPNTPRTANFFERFTDSIGEKINQKLDQFKSSNIRGAGVVDFVSQRLGRSKDFIARGDQFKGSDNYRLNVSKNLMQKINEGMDEPTKITLSKVLRGEAKPESLPKNLVQKYTEIRSLNDAIHEVNYGSNGILASQTKRLYQTGEITDAQYKARMKEIQGKYKANQGKYYADMYEPYELVEGSNNTASKGMKSGMFKAKKDLPAEWKEQNIINDPAYITAKRVYDTYHNIEYYKYSDYIHGMQNMWSNTPRRGYIQIPDSSNYGLLSGKYVRSDAARDILGFVTSNDTINSALHFFNILNKPRQVIKAGKTVLNPALYPSNDFSNRVFAWSNGAPELAVPKNKWMKFAKEQIKNNGAYYRELQKNNVVGTDYTKQEFGYKQSLIEPKKNIFKRGFEKAQKIYGGIDDSHKVAAYKYWIDKGMTSEQAIAKVKASFQDYSRVSMMWDVASKVPVVGKPFAKFTPELVRILGNGMKSNPLWTVSLFGAIHAAGEYLSSQNETPEQRALRESDPRSGKMFGFLPTTWITPYGEIDFKRYMMVNQLTQVNEKMASDNLLARAGVPDVLNFTDTNGDVLLSPLYQAAQNENYLGKPIYKDAGERGFDALKKIGKHVADAYLPVPITPNSLDKIGSALTTNEGNLNTNITAAGKPDQFGKRRSPLQVGLEVGAGVKFRQMDDSDRDEIEQRVVMDLENDVTNRIKQINSFMYQRGVSEEEKLKFLNNAIQYAKEDYANDPEKQGVMVSSIENAGNSSLRSFKADNIYQTIRDKSLDEKMGVWAKYISTDMPVAKILLDKIKSNMMGKNRFEEMIGKRKVDVQAGYIKFKIQDKTPEEAQKIIGDMLARGVVSKGAFKRYYEIEAGL